MENFNLKRYYYDKLAEGLSAGRIAELLGISVEELMEQVEGTKHAEKPVKKDSEPVEKPKPKVIKEPEKPVEERKPAEEPEDDSQSWLDD